jgi:hypothetical protein
MILCLCCTSYASLSCAVGAKRTVADGGPFLSLQRSRLVLFRMGVDQSFFEYSTPQIHPNSERPHGTLISGSSEWGWLGRLFNFEKIEVDSNAVHGGSRPVLMETNDRGDRSRDAVVAVVMYTDHRTCRIGSSKPNA